MKIDKDMTQAEHDEMCNAIGAALVDMFNMIGHDESDGRVTYSTCRGIRNKLGLGRELIRLMEEGQNDISK